MMSAPKQGEICLLRYKAEDAMPLNNKVGVVVIVGHGRPRNHGVVVDGHLHIVPAGQMQRALPTAEALWNAHQDLCKYKQKQRTDAALPEIAGLQPLIDRLYREHHAAQVETHP